MITFLLCLLIFVFDFDFVFVLFGLVRLRESKGGSSASDEDLISSGFEPINWQQCVDYGVDGMKESLDSYVLRFLDGAQWETVCESVKHELYKEADSDSFAVNQVFVMLTRTSYE